VFEVAYETTFCATHTLSEDGRPIEPVHGHDWRVEVVASGDRLDRTGVVVDFEHLRKAVNEVAGRFHYGDLTGHPHFGRPEPVGRGRGSLLLRRGAQGDGCREGGGLRRVRVWEAPGCSATYYE